VDGYVGRAVVIGEFETSGYVLDETSVPESVGIVVDGTDVLFVEPSLERTLLSSERNSSTAKRHILD
jgi:hypothetical protein